MICKSDYIFRLQFKINKKRLYPLMRIYEMKRLITYLTFNGNCREAMSFYRDCLGGELQYQTIGETPDAGKIPENMKRYIFQATLIKDNCIIVATDLVCDSQLIKGNSVSILIECTNKKEMKTFYKKLSEGGNPVHPIQNTFWDTWFGGLTDKYNNNWLLQYK